MKRSAGRPRGFTLVEVMITVAIVAILGAIALPFVHRHDPARKAGRRDGAARRLPRPAGKVVPRQPHLPDGPARRDGLRHPQPGAGCRTTPSSSLATRPTATTYTVTATGRAAGGMDPLFVYTVDQANVRASSGPLGWSAGAGCWAVRKDGSCQ